MAFAAWLVTAAFALGPLPFFLPPPKNDANGVALAGAAAAACGTMRFGAMTSAMLRMPIEFSALRPTTSTTTRTSHSRSERSCIPATHTHTHTYTHARKHTRTQAHTHTRRNQHSASNHSRVARAR